MSSFRYFPAARGRALGAIVALLLAALPSVSRAQAVPSASGSSAQAVPDPRISVVNDAAGSRLQVDGRDFMVFGMNWDYYPIGTNYMFDLWSQPDDFIEAVLAREMPMLKGMGVNAVRIYAGIPPRWVRHIYERYGIYTVVNHPMARYGYTLNGVWIPSVDYSDPRLREAVKTEIVNLVDSFRGTPGVLMWLLGNENNYGLSWRSSEIEALPEGERDAARARHLYSLFGEIARAIKAEDSSRPVAISNGDVQYIDLIAAECRDIDILGVNAYRGISARDLFQVVKDKLGIPVFFSEFGSDAFNARDMREDQVMQARYLLGQWREIYEQSSGKGNVGNAIGGCVFQWTDGWWKFGQTSRLDVHDTNASWPNGGYAEDFVPGANNMNEEWWGITAKGPSGPDGMYDIYPRAAYYALRDAFRLDPYAPTTDLAAIRAHFGAIEPVSAAASARADRSALMMDHTGRVRLSGLRLEFETFSTGGSRVTTPEQSGVTAGYPAFRGFDHMQSFYTDFEAKPADNVTGRLSINILGHVAVNPIDEIFYENRGRIRSVDSEGGTLQLTDNERIKLYRAGVTWEEPNFLLDGFYRTGHFHWGYEGDFFGLYREANYGENIDIYNGEAPVGLEVTGRRTLSGLKFAIGPELWWGANPAFLVKYTKPLGPLTATGIVQDDIDNRVTATTSSFALPVPPTRKATLQVATTRGPFGLELGGIWSGQTKVGDKFEIAAKEGNDYRLYQDEVVGSDALGAKGKLTFTRGRLNWYGQAAYMGIVAEAGPTATMTYTGWNLKDSGSGNQANILTGLALNMGTIQVAPNFLYQKPIVGPLPRDPEGRWTPRNILDDPFVVRSNRETVGTELLLTWDPTPATWFWMWDNDVQEDARFAASFGWTLRHLPTTQDAALYISADGQTFPFPGATPPRDLWEARSRIVSRLGKSTRIVAHIYGGTAEPNGENTRLVKRFGVDGRIASRSLAFETFAKFNDFGPYDYHRDFNLTFPVQIMGDVSHTLGKPVWFGFPQTRVGARATWRSLDKYSPRYAPTVLSDTSGDEWEIRTYLHLAM